MIAGFSIAPAVAIHGAEAAKRLIDRMVRRGPAALQAQDVLNAWTASPGGLSASVSVTRGTGGRPDHLVILRERGRPGGLRDHMGRAETLPLAVRAAVDEWQRDHDGAPLTWLSSYVPLDDE